MAFNLDNPPWARAKYDFRSDNWGDEQDRSEWFEAAASYWCSRATRAERRLAKKRLTQSEREAVLDTISEEIGALERLAREEGYEMSALDELRTAIRKLRS